MRRYFFIFLSIVSFNLLTPRFSLAVDLYYNNAQNNGSWDDLSNWWLENTFINQASSLPTGSDNVFIYGNVSSASSPVANELSIFNSYSITNVSINTNGNVTFRDSAILGSGTTISLSGTSILYFYDYSQVSGGSIVGNGQEGRFYDDSINNGTITDISLTFYDDAQSQGSISHFASAPINFLGSSKLVSGATVTANALFACGAENSGTVTGSISYSACSLYFHGGSDWNNIPNWWLDSGYTEQAIRLPTSADTVNIYANVSSNSGGTPSVSVANIFSSQVYIPFSAGDIVLNGNSSLNSISVTGDVVFNNTSSASSVNITGDANFYDTSSSGSNLTITGDANFYEYSEFTADSTVQGDVYFECTATNSGGSVFHTTEYQTCVSNISSSNPNGYYGVGDIIDIYVEFTDTIFLTGNPTLYMDSSQGGSGSYATVTDLLQSAYNVGSTQIDFQLEILDGMHTTDLDYLNVNSLSLEGGTLTDGNSRNASTTLFSQGATHSLGANKNIIIDTTDPSISSIASSTTATTATITWNTDESSDSKVAYGTVTGTYTTFSSSPSLVTNHSISLSSLISDTTYYFVVVSKDASNNIATSSEHTFITTSSVDITDPTVSLTSPSSGSVSGNITVSASASDDVAVAGVTFYLDNLPIGSEDVSSPFTISFDTTTKSNGSYTFYAVARDGSNNYATSTGISVTINNSSGSGGSGGSSGSSSGARSLMPVSSPNLDNPLKTNDNYSPVFCEPYLKKFMKMGGNNDPEEVKKLQIFLNVFEQEILNINGIFDAETDLAVRRFQAKYPDILSFWGIKNPTGFVYITTINAINKIRCEKIKGLSCPYFNSLDYAEKGDFGPKVLKIKKFLTLLEGANLGVGDKFDDELKNAVSNFQKKYKEKILVPWGFALPTGFWYQSTTKVANDLLGCFEPKRLDNGKIIE